MRKVARRLNAEAMRPGRKLARALRKNARGRDETFVDINPRILRLGDNLKASRLPAHLRVTTAEGAENPEEHEGAHHHGTPSRSAARRSALRGIAMTTTALPSARGRTPVTDARSTSRWTAWAIGGVACVRASASST